MQEREEEEEEEAAGSWAKVRWLLWFPGVMGGVYIVPGRCKVCSSSQTIVGFLRFVYVFGHRSPVDRRLVFFFVCFDASLFMLYHMYACRAANGSEKQTQAEARERKEEGKERKGKEECERTYIHTCIQLAA